MKPGTFARIFAPCSWQRGNNFSYTLWDNPRMSYKAGSYPMKTVGKKDLFVYLRTVRVEVEGGACNRMAEILMSDGTRYWIGEDNLVEVP